jgi:hypothetical protein
MPRTTVNIDAPILRELKRLQRKEGKSMGRLISDLVAQTLARMRTEKTVASPKLQWTARQMVAKVDIDDKEAVRAVLDEAAAPEDRAPEAE